MGFSVNVIEPYPILIFKEGDRWVAVCKELSVRSWGYDIEEAFTRVAEAADKIQRKLMEKRVLTPFIEDFDYFWARQVSNGVDLDLIDAIVFV